MATKSVRLKRTGSGLVKFQIVLKLVLKLVDVLIAYLEQNKPKPGESKGSQYAKAEDLVNRLQSFKNDYSEA